MHPRVYAECNASAFSECALYFYASTQFDLLEKVDLPFSRENKTWMDGKIEIDCIALDSFVDFVLYSQVFSCDKKPGKLVQKSGARDKKLAILYTCYSLICCREMYFLQISAEKWRMYFTSPKMDFILRMLLLFYGTWNLKHTHSVLIHLFSWMNLCCVHKYLCTLLWNYSDLS